MLRFEAGELLVIVFEPTCAGNDAAGTYTFVTKTSTSERRASSAGNDLVLKQYWVGFLMTAKSCLTDGLTWQAAESLPAVGQPEP